MAGAYQVNVSATDDETFEWSREWVMEDGSDFPWSDYTYEYSCERGRTFRGVVGNGVEVDPENNIITFSAPGGTRLRPGRYEHGCIITHVETGKKIQIFDGSITITEGGA